MIPDTTTLLSPSSKRSCSNVNPTLPKISGINNRHCQLALIATPRYMALKLPNQYHALLITRQIIHMLRHTSPLRANPINQGNLNASISTWKTKEYIRLTIILPLKLTEKISTQKNLTLPTRAIKSCRSTSWEWRLCVIVVLSSSNLVLPSTDILNQDAIYSRE